MVLGLVNDLTSNVVLDSQLTSPTSGVYLNSGVHSSITIKNLLSILPESNYTVLNYSPASDYGNFTDSRLMTDIVTDGSLIYESVKSSNTGNALTDTNYWLLTNIDSVKLKVFIQKVEDRVYNDLSLERKLVNNQYLYEVGDNEIVLPSNYSAWTFEARGSDYVKFRLNQIAIQANTTGNVNVYVVNQGLLLSTLSIPVTNGAFNWTQSDYEFSGHGKFHFVIDSQSVNVGDNVVDPFNFEGFIAYTSTGTGATPQSAEYTDYMLGVGIGVNLSVYFDPQKYITNNAKEFSQFIRSAFEYVFFETAAHNSGNRSNSGQRTLMDIPNMALQLTDLTNNTVGKRYNDNLKMARNLMRKAHDVQLSQSGESGEDSLTVETGSM
jgi:hypothetical protein